jgi:hypothetical protein
MMDTCKVVLTVDEVQVLRLLAGLDGITAGSYIRRLIAQEALKRGVVPVITQSSSFIATREQFERAFAEWERRYREEPSKFMSEMEKAAETLQTYGECAAAYFVLLLEETNADHHD